MAAASFWGGVRPKKYSEQQELASKKNTYSNFLYFNLLIIEFNSNPSNNIMQFIQI
jgi:hypothetical protein